MTLQQLYLVLLAGGLVLLASIVATRAATTVGLPALLLFLGVGVIVGEDGLGLHFENYLLADHLGTVALAIILIEGGLTTKFSDVRRVLAPAGMLATLGVAVSMVITAAGAHLLLGMDWQLAFLLGAIVSSTDAAAVFSVLRVVPLPRRVAGLLEAESGFNDAPAVILVLMFSATPLELSPVHARRRTGLRARCRRRDRAGVRASRLNRAAPHRPSRIRSVSAGELRARAWSRSPRRAAPMPVGSSPRIWPRSCSPTPDCRTGRRPARSPKGWVGSRRSACSSCSVCWSTPAISAVEIVPAIVIGLVLLLIARPASVVISLAAFRVPWKEQTFLSWAGLRGAVPIVLATFPIVEGVPDAIRLLNIVFILVVVFTLVQGPSLGALAHRLGLIPKEATREIQVEAAPLDVLEAELLTMTVHSPSRLHGVTVLELRLPDPSVITLIIRDGHTFVPQPDTRIAAGDELLIVTTPKTRTAAERRLRAVSRRGKLAYWFDEFGEAE